MLQEQQRVGNAIGLALLDERGAAARARPRRERGRAAAPAQRVVLRESLAASAISLNCAGSKFSMPFFTSAMN